MACETVLFDTGVLAVRDLRCQAPRGGCGVERGGERSHLALVRHGAFGYHPGRRCHLADPVTALFHHATLDYRISHPLSGGDRCTVIELAPALEEEAFGSDALRGRRIEFAVDPRSQAAHLALCRQLEDDTGDRMAGEERVFELLLCLRRLPVLVPPPPGAARQRLRRRIDDARVLLARQLHCNLSAGAIAEALEISPFHLMRSFRAYTGQSLRGYRRRLRVAAALEGMATGRPDLTALALEVGFASHSHMDAAFRQELGVVPAAMRRQLSPARSRRLRTFLQAGQGMAT